MAVVAGIDDDAIADSRRLIEAHGVFGRLVATPGALGVVVFVLLDHIDDHAIDGDVLTGRGDARGFGPVLRLAVPEHSVRFFHGSRDLKSLL